MQWNEEFEMEFLQRIDYKRKTTYIPQLDNNSALTVSKLFEYYMYQVIKRILFNFQRERIEYQTTNLLYFYEYKRNQRKYYVS